MTNYISFLVLILSCLYLVSACDFACTSSGESGGKCYYTCYEGVCHMTAEHHQMMFLRGLASKRYACRGLGNDGVECDKTTQFGTCESHYWRCGGGCS